MEIGKNKKQKIKLFVAPGEIYSTINGTLKFNEGDNNIFKLCDLRDGVSLAECEISGDMVDEAKSLLGEEVAVSGRCIYKSITRFPDRVIEISKIHVIADDPSALYGLLKIKEDITNGKPTLDWIEEVRSNFE